MRKTLAVILCLSAGLFLAGCSQNMRDLADKLRSLYSSGAGQSEDAGIGMEKNAVKYEADTVYYNSFLELSYTVPKGWWLYRLHQDNFSPDRDETADIDSLDISYGEDAGERYSYIGLISFANLQLSTRDNHLGFLVSAETLEGITSLAGYMDYYERYMLQPDDSEYRLLDSGRVEINGLPYERRIFEVVRQADNYNYITLTRAAPNGYYLTFRISYWPENRNAEAIILKALSKAML
ncbi:MAG: hypothetical protein LBD48_10910 [Treponema sp.]|jgi:hypothetical protein|nr:hypothetical protein [Treponema sp.]